MLIEYIERLRKESIEVRRQAVSFWTIVSVGVVILVYIGVLFIQKSFSDSTIEDAIAAPYESVEER